MIDLFTSPGYELNDCNYLAEMRCTWTHAGTKLTLIEMTWHTNVQKSFHLLVEELGGSTSPPVSLGINDGWSEIEQAMKARIPPPDLLRIILETNPELEALVLKHSPNTEQLVLKAQLSPTPPQLSPPSQPPKLKKSINWKGIAEFFRGRW